MRLIKVMILLLVASWQFALAGEHDWKACESVAGWFNIIYGNDWSYEPIASGMIHNEAEFQSTMEEFNNVAGPNSFVDYFPFSGPTQPDGFVMLFVSLWSRDFLWNVWVSDAGEAGGSPICLFKVWPVAPRPILAPGSPDSWG